MQPVRQHLAVAQRGRQLVAAGIDDQHLAQRRSERRAAVAGDRQRDLVRQLPEVGQRAPGGTAPRPAREITGAAPGTASSSSSTRFSSARNSSLRNSSFIVERSGGSLASEVRSTSTVEAAVDGGQHLRLLGVLGGRAQRLAPLLAGHLVQMLVDALQAAELDEQVGGGLLADARHALDVVRRVTLEADEVGDQLGADAVALADPVGRVDDDVGHAARRHHDADAVGGQLERVAVGGDDAHPVAVLVAARGQRADHVVGLLARDAHVAVAEGVDDRLEERLLLAQQRRRRAAAGLVLGVELEPLRGLLVPGHDAPSAAGSPSAAASSCWRSPAARWSAAPRRSAAPREARRRPGRRGRFRRPGRCRIPWPGRPTDRCRTASSASPWPPMQPTRSGGCGLGFRYASPPHAAHPLRLLQPDHADRDPVDAGRVRAGRRRDRRGRGRRRRDRPGAGHPRSHRPRHHGVGGRLRPRPADRRCRPPGRRRDHRQRLRPHLPDAPRRQDRRPQQGAGEDARRPLDGLHAGRRARLPGDRRGRVQGPRADDQAEHGRRCHRRHRGARAWATSGRRRRCR